MSDAVETPAEPDPPAFPDIPGHHVIRHIASGGFGHVFEAIDPLGRPEAIKVSDSVFTSRRLWYEAIALRAVKAPTVPEIYDDGHLRPYRYLAMEWVDSPTLAERMAEYGGALSVTEFCLIVPRMLNAVEELHKAGFVHRDLKPEHIILDRTRERLRVRLLDLGLVYPIDAEEPHRVRWGNRVLGTSAYMAPEQVELGPISPQTDIYALGIIMYEMLTGDIPFSGTSTQMQAGHVSVRPPRLPALRVPVPVERVVHRCLLKDSTKRYASVKFLRIALTRAVRRCGADLLL